MARKGGTGSLLPLELDGEGAAPLFQRLYLEMRRAVLEGRLRPGVRLPATRSLARELGVSRNTVLTAYDQLASEGFLELRHRSGAFVAVNLPIASQPPAAIEAPIKVPAPRLGRRGSWVLAAGPVGTGNRSSAKWPGCFAIAMPDVASFPFALWARLLARTWRRPAARCRSAAIRVVIRTCAPPSRTILARRAASAATPIMCWW